MTKDDLSLQQFTAVDHARDLPAYIEALIAFDAIEQLQELKQIAREAISPTAHVLDVGCGFGLETERLARLVTAGPAVAGIDASAHFIDEARRRASAEGLVIEYQVGLARDLPFKAATFDHVRAERLLIYLDDVRKAIAEMWRVLRPGGSLALIEPNFGTVTLNLADRDLVRRVMLHECERAVAQSWLPGPLLSILRAEGFQSIKCRSRVVIFPQDLGQTYFSSVARNAAQDGAISEAEHRAWNSALGELTAGQALFGTIDYFLFTATL